MRIRAKAGSEIRVAAAAGTLAELRIQDLYTPLEVAAGETEAVWPASATEGLYFGRREALEGELWLGKARHRLTITR